MNPLTLQPDRLRRLRSVCLALPEAAEKVAWGDPTWRVRDKIFAMQKGNFEGGRPSLWLKAPEGAQRALVEGAPERFFVPPYVGNKGWIGLYLDTRNIDWPLLESLVDESYRLIAPKKLAAAAGAAPAAAVRRRQAPPMPSKSRPSKPKAPTASKKKKKPSPSKKKAVAPTRKTTAPPAPESATAKRTGKKASPRKAPSRLTRPRHAMPRFVKAALSERGLTGAYQARPNYQQNDYLGWIGDAKLEQTQHKRLDQMLHELDDGRLYMNMRWK